MKSITPEAFRDELIAIPNFMDEQGVIHHELKSGLHSVKIDFGVVVPGMPEYDHWVELNKQAINKRHSKEHELYIIGVDTGTTQLAYDVAEAIGHRAVALRTNKRAKGDVRLTQAARYVLSKDMRGNPVWAVVVEDAGSTGETSGDIALQARNAGAEHVEVQNTWQRSLTLPFLEMMNIEHHAIIREVIPAVSPEDCLATGDCSHGVRLVRHGEEV